MNTYDMISRMALMAVSCAIIWKAPIVQAAPESGGAAWIKKVTGDHTLQINGRSSKVQSGQRVALPATVATTNSRIMLTLPGRMIALGKNSECTILASGEIEIGEQRGGAVAVQPADGTVQEIYYMGGVDEIQEGARAWTGGDLEESAGEVAKIARSRARARVSSLAIAFAPAPDRGGYFKVMLFEGSAEVRVEDEVPIQLHSNEMSQVRVEKGGQLDDAIRCDDFNLAIAVETSALIRDFEDCWNLDPVQSEIERQEQEIRDGMYLSFRRHRERRAPRKAVEDRQIIRGLRGKSRH